MGISRREWLKRAAISAVSVLVPDAAPAQTYPTRPVRWVVGFPPGGSSSTITRVMADWLSQRFGQPVIVENKPGASGNLAVQAVSGAAPDGYTLLLVPASGIVNRAVFSNLPFDILQDIAPVSGLIAFPLVMLVNPTVPASTVAEFIDYARGSAGKLNMASFGTGTTSHLAGELFQMRTDTKMVHVPFRGEAAALTELIAGRVQVMFDVLTGSLPHIRSGTLRAIGMAGSGRDEALPGVPPIADTVAGYEANSWIGVGVPKNTPTTVIELLNREINSGLRNPTIRKRLSDLSARPMFFTAAEFERYMHTEADKWARVVSAVGLKG